MNQDPASEQTENHYKGLQAKVADAVRLEILLNCRIYSGNMYFPQIPDHCMSVMLTYIILFSPDSVQLENKKIIEKIQVKEKIFVV